jgi:hypothetical protein
MESRPDKNFTRIYPEKLRKITTVFSKDNRHSDSAPPDYDVTAAAGAGSCAVSVRP